MHTITLVTPLRRLLVPIAVIAVVTALALVAVVVLGSAAAAESAEGHAEGHKGEIEILPW